MTSKKKSEKREVAFSAKFLNKMTQITIKKASGERVPFDPDKVLRSINRSGVEGEKAQKILEKVKANLTPGITTDEIYRLVREELKQESPAAHARYNLRQSLLKLGPAGFNFEKYVASILTAYGYKTQLPHELEGACVSHEVDVIAEKDGRRMFIEAKFRNRFEDVVNIKDTMATWARYLDLVDGAKINLCPHFDEAWIVTNARFTDHALKYGHCKNMVMIGWNHPKERTFARMVDLSSLYPITLIEDMNDQEFQAFAQKDIILCREIAEKEPVNLSKKTGIKEARMKKLIERCTQIVGEKHK